MKAKGFTLIELMIVIVIVAIIMSIAVPSYRKYVIGAKINEAYNTLATYQVQMEQSYQDSNNYGTGSACSVTLPTGTYFNYTCTLTASGQSFIATATAKGVQGVTGYTFTIDHNGNKATTAFPGSTVPASCWLSSSSGC